ncbi:MAG: ribosomal subunit interface protein [Betaproteobacteria bacterium]|nr:ribosomal subunit interface protein [Betaproteobacteria bacterium]
MRQISTDEIRRLVKPDAVHQRVYTDPAIFELEMARIFESNWVYAAHESEIRAPGDYVRARIGRRDILIVRIESGGIAAFHNRCAHRGSMIARPIRGHVKAFNCPYHGWSYDCEGKLIGVPVSRGYYPEGFVEDAKRRLEPVARVASYRGFIFVSLAADVPELEEYLAPVRDSIDNMVDRAPDGELVKEGGEFRQICNCNWKLHTENVFDVLHAFFLHESSWASAKDWQRDSDVIGELNQQVQMLKANSLPPRESERVELRSFEHGHAILGGFYNDTKIGQESPEPWFAQYKDALIRRHGKERTKEILALDRFNTLIYPNLVINIRFQHVRVFEPVSVNRSIVRAFCLRLGGAPEDLFQIAVKFLTSLNSPASMISQDDHEVFNRMQRVLTSERHDALNAAEWINIARGREREQPHADGSIDAASGLSELPLRAQFNAWVQHMSA